MRQLKQETLPAPESEIRDSQLISELLGVVSSSYIAARLQSAWSSTLNEHRDTNRRNDEQIQTQHACRAWPSWGSRDVTGNALFLRKQKGR